MNEPTRTSLNSVIDIFVLEGFDVGGCNAARAIAASLGGGVTEAWVTWRYLFVLDRIHGVAAYERTPPPPALAPHRGQNSSSSRSFGLHIAAIAAVVSSAEIAWR